MAELAQVPVKRKDYGATLELHPGDKVLVIRAPYMRDIDKAGERV